MPISDASPGGSGGGGGGGGGLGGAFITCGANTTGLVVNTPVLFSDVEQPDGFGVTIASGRITLPAGGWYRLDAEVGGRCTASSGYIDLRWHNVTGGGAIPLGTRIQFHRPDATFPSSQPKVAWAIVDATEAAVEVELRVVALSNADYIHAESSAFVTRLT